jgi:hypothetical protein
MRGNEEQPFINEWPMFEEAHSKFPCLADVKAARLRLAQKFNRALPKAVEVELAWRAHNRSTRLLRG